MFSLLSLHKHLSILQNFFPKLQAHTEFTSVLCLLKGQWTQIRRYKTVCCFRKKSGDAYHERKSPKGVQEIPLSCCKVKFVFITPNIQCLKHKFLAGIISLDLFSLFFHMIRLIFVGSSVSWPNLAFLLIQYLEEFSVFQWRIEWLSPMQRERQASEKNRLFCTNQWGVIPFLFATGQQNGNPLRTAMLFSPLWTLCYL